MSDLETVLRKIQPFKPEILTIAVHGKELPRYITRELRKLMQEEA